jgi:hypothetical protein
MEAASARFPQAKFRRKKTQLVHRASWEAWESSIQFRVEGNTAEET